MTDSPKFIIGPLTDYVMPKSENVLKHWKFYQSKSGRCWAWDSTHRATCLLVRLQIWWDRMFGKPVMQISDELFK